MGFTQDSTGAVLPNCVVKAYKTSNDALLGTALSGSDGSFSIAIGQVQGPFYIVAYLVGNPDVMGTTVNTIVGTN
jgi:hypothetical protein